MRHLIPLTLLLLITARSLPGGEVSDEERAQRIGTAVERGLKVAEKAARSYPEHRKCFSCHHQTLPMLAIAEARDAGFQSDAKLLKAQLQFSKESFESRRESLQRGTGIGGRAATVGYALWTLAIAGDEPSELAGDMITYLLKMQHEQGYWRPPSNRPPLEQSPVSCTVLAAYGMQQYAGDSQQADAAAAIERAKSWLAEAPLESQEDLAARLWGLHLLDGTVDEMKHAREAVLKTQRSDGGWSQLPQMESDAYATGQSLWVLLQTGTPANELPLRRAIDFLLRTQLEDGSWHVKTRSKPVQVFFDNGDPHGKDQFISVAATSWAVAALAKALPRK